MPATRMGPRTPRTGRPKGVPETKPRPKRAQIEFKGEFPRVRLPLRPQDVFAQNSAVEVF